MTFVTNRRSLPLEYPRLPEIDCPRSARHVGPLGSRYEMNMVVLTVWACGTPQTAVVPDTKTERSWQYR